eukprot:CAMPEP_0113297798 /NCGR_PEP_ID=MMETSP0010_2-20120614/508_1 /TAXON_ID=216773 ORGANISM="Corethron hystrix, Strain 308" /NCGR_SAMPLE_ID=MMETSP0010_2 /ASSEMBLY_ACC=CAM_ASM_000155 /LENGTH=109 /DNA_ID=CAMNT_0000150743 /DNA_START=196 /DNA_END=525 /DNA_ORIENTATION=+ /assembly_acc=CAM_ASM_000155
MISDDVSRRRRLTDSITSLAPISYETENEFQRQLTILGNEVQAEARRKYEAKEQVDENEIEDGKNETGNSKSEEELRIWALVDMMVQSKMIFKSIRENSSGNGDIVNGS